MQFKHQNSNIFQLNNDANCKNNINNDKNQNPNANLKTKRRSLIYIKKNELSRKEKKVREFFTL